MHVEVCYQPCAPEEDQLGLLSARWHAVEKGVLVEYTTAIVVYRRQFTPRQVGRLQDYPVAVLKAMARILASDCRE